MSISTSPSGIDVSNHQGVVDWDAVAASGMAFGFAKATEGHYFDDGFFTRNWSEMRRVGMARGAYHFARPSTATPDIEAQFFLHSIRNAGELFPGDMLVLDLEDERYHGGGPYGSAGNWALGFLEYVEDSVGFPPLLYWATWYRPDDIAATPALSRYPLWLANYRATLPPTPDPWDTISFWQYSSSGYVPGVSGNCDMNMFTRAPEHLASMGKPGAIPDEPHEPDLPTFSVGPGILQCMRDFGDDPATNEYYVTPDWSEAYAVSGRKYVYIASINEVVTFEPT